MLNHFVNWFKSFIECLHFPLSLQNSWAWQYSRMFTAQILDLIFLGSKPGPWASLVAQWLRIRLPRQGTRVRSLVREDPTCRGAAKPVHHNYWACALEPVSHNYWAHVPQLLKPACLEPCSTMREATAMRSPHTAMKSGPRSPQLEKARAQQRRSNTAKNK